MLEQSSTGQPRLSTQALEPRTVVIELECYAADEILMLECARAH